MTQATTPATTPTSPRIAITGGHGFLGWHLASRLRALHGIEAIRLGRDAFTDHALLDDAMAHSDAVIHLAGVVATGDEHAREHGNIELAETLAAGVRRADHPIHVVHANTIHALGDSPYGRGKRRAGEILAATGVATDVLIPNLFGEHGKPDHNSFVATFAHQVASGRTPTVTKDADVPLLHVQDAAAVLIDAVTSGTTGELRPEGQPIKVSRVLALLEQMHELYATRGEVPPLPGRFEVNLFNTYRANRFPDMWPLSPAVSSDPRGDLVETVRSHGGTGQAFVSTTRPGQVRGEHYHLHRFERFFVVSGEAEISLRRLLHDDVVTFRLSGERPSYVDMPTLWVHQLRNVGDDDLVTMFWSDQLLDPERPDQYPERVFA